MGRTIFIGDVHGCKQEFATLLHRLDYDPVCDRLYLTGDSFARGPDPAGVLDLIHSSGAQAVIGNHDWKTLRCIIHNKTGAFPDEKFSKSQRTTLLLMPERIDELAHYLESLPVSIVGRRWVLVHAGVHPQLGPLGTDLRTALTIRTFPDYDSMTGPHWYDLYRGPKMVVFGHDARGGLVRREHNGRLTAIGLDTGCVYGGRLSSWILEQDRIIDVQAEDMYYDPVRNKFTFLD